MPLPLPMPLPSIDAIHASSSDFNRRGSAQELLPPGKQHIQITPPNQQDDLKKEPLEKGTAQASHSRTVFATANNTNGSTRRPARPKTSASIKADLHSRSLSACPTAQLRHSARCPLRWPEDTLHDLSLQVIQTEQVPTLGYWASEQLQVRHLHAPALKLPWVFCLLLLSTVQKVQTCHWHIYLHSAF